MPKIGIIAEDKSDVAVVKVLIERLRGGPISVKPFVGHGCGRIFSKSAAWARELVGAGCKFLLVVHDLDGGNFAELERRLRKAIEPSPAIDSLILIPVQEIEAWLLFDEAAISKFFNLKTHLKKIPSPERIRNPKERLGQLAYQSSGGKKRYINSIHNEHIARAIALAKLRSCQSFAPLESFVRNRIR